jgi:hypothetical protein
MLRSLVVLALFAAIVSTSASSGVQGGSSRRARMVSSFSSATAFTQFEPKPLRGVQLVGSTGLRLLVASDPPFLLNVDTGSVKPISGLQVRDKPVLSVLAVGRDAVVWLDRRVPAKVPAAEVYVVRSGATVAKRIASAWDVAPAADGRAVWLKSFTAARRCILRELRLDGRTRRAPRWVLCSTRLVDAGARALLVRGSSAVDPSTGRVLLRTGGLWAMAGHFALTTDASHGRLSLTDLHGGDRWRLGWPSRIGGGGSQGGTDEAAVQKNGKLVALAFSDPAYRGGGTQVTDVWLLDPATRRLRHLPDMPATVALKFTSMTWTSDGRLVILAESGGRDVVAVWRPGKSRIAVRPVRLPARESGSDSFVAWVGARSR